MDTLRIAVGWVTLVFVAALGAAILYKVFTNQIDLKWLLGNDKAGDASMSRFQLLIFTFVVALSFFFLVTRTDVAELPNVPGSVLTMLGISGTAYLVSKGIDRDPSDSNGDGNGGTTGTGPGTTTGTGQGTSGSGQGTPR